MSHLIEGIEEFTFFILHEVGVPSPIQEFILCHVVADLSILYNITFSMVTMVA